MRRHLKAALASAFLYVFARDELRAGRELHLVTGQEILRVHKELAAAEEQAAEDRYRAEAEAVGWDIGPWSEDAGSLLLWRAGLTPGYGDALADEWGFMDGGDE